MFPRPPVRRQTLGTQAASIASQPVKSEDELRVAIGNVAAAQAGVTTTNLGAITGAEIVLTSSFTVSAPITIPSTCQGLTIRGAGRVPILASGVVSSLFVVEASALTLRGFFIKSPDASNVFTYALVQPASASSATGSCVVDDVLVFGGGVLSCVGSVASNWLLRGVTFANTIAAAAFAIDGDLQNGRIEGCKFTGANGIQIGAGGGRCAIVGNVLSGAAITTNASSGLNTIVGNANCGVITAAGSDAAAGNT